MTTIAWDGKRLAADSRASAGTRSHSTRKIERLADGSLFGFCGCLSYYTAVRDWIAAGADESDPPKSRGSECIVVRNDNSVLVYENCKVSIPVTDSIAAIGTGAEYALGAMTVGASAAEAVAAACRFDPSSAPPIVVIEH